MVIHKYQLVDITTRIVMPVDTQILHLDMQDGVVTLWAMHGDSVHLEANEETPTTYITRTFVIICTGAHFSVDNKDYIGTVLDGRLVWHIFEQLN